MLAERRGELLSIDVAEVLHELKEEDPEDRELALHEALLELARLGHEERGLRALADPEAIPALLGELARDDDIPSLEALASLAVSAKVSAEIRSSALFHRGIVLAISNTPEEAAEAVREALRLDTGQVARWLALLVELAPRNPEVLPLARELSGDES